MQSEGKSVRDSLFNFDVNHALCGYAHSCEKKYRELEDILWCHNDIIKQICYSLVFPSFRLTYGLLFSLKDFFDGF